MASRSKFSEQEAILHSALIPVRQVYWHTGGAFGFVTNTCSVPEEKLAITILTNGETAAGTGRLAGTCRQEK